MKHFIKEKYYKNGKIVRSVYTDYSDARCYGSGVGTCQPAVQSGTSISVSGSQNSNDVVQAGDSGFVPEAESLTASDLAFESGRLSDTVTNSKNEIDESRNSRAVYNAIHVLTDVLDNNFGSNDKEVTLTVSPDGFAALFGNGTAEENLTTMRTAMQKVFRNVRLMAARAGVPCKYVWVVSDIDGDSGKSVRVHAHGVVNGDLLPILEKIWSPFGSVNAKPLREKNHTYAALARYMIMQSCAAPGEKRYSASRNLAKPVEIKREIPAPLLNIVFAASPEAVLVGCTVLPGYVCATYYSQALKDDYSGYIRQMLSNSSPMPVSTGSDKHGRKPPISPYLSIRS